MNEHTSEGCSTSSLAGVRQGGAEEVSFGKCTRALVDLGWLLCFSKRAVMSWGLRVR